MDIEITGDGPQQIIALHGIQGTRVAWRPVAEACSKFATFHLPNLRGRGRALRPATADGYELAEFAGELDMIINETTTEAPFILAGWSMGVSVILQWLSQSPGKRPAALILASGTPAPCHAPWFTAQGDALIEQIAMREQRLGLKEAADQQAVAWTWQSLRHIDHRRTLASIPEPALILHGSDDQDSPYGHAHWLADGLHASRLVALQGAGHSVLTENTTQVADHLGQFIHSLARN
ncbi:alpha/beta fold hydrolase [Pseudomonas putida]|uniref:alpha/beta fold hydrolase n=1 Tax=Pseudomonas putida TaxID=303 RepID=UPI0023633B8B|nr:alpha/beta hydrolase [Pseudomonas putida]MDD2002018.1 alpha/beta hydrolase [Pseudomonas putida]